MGNEKQKIPTLTKAGINTLLVFVSLLFCIVIVEISLRLFYPKYQNAAESELKHNTTRIWANSPNSFGTYQHPDTGKRHAVIHNNLSLRQHRNFSRESLETSTNIAFFGDSFTENSRIPAQYSFTEPLDYLLNLSGRRFNVLNFGVDGYGTDQCYLFYRELDYAKKLNYVFYVFCVNDLRNIYINNIFSTDKSGSLVQNKYNASPFYIKIISKLHLTYFVLDALKRTFPAAFDLNDKDIVSYFDETEFKKRQRLQRADDAMENFDKKLVKKSLDIFMAIIRDWQKQVKKNGGKFYIVLLPRHWESSIYSLVKDDFNVIDLYQIFNNTIDHYIYSDYKLKNDIHWNETANLVTAVSIYRYLKKMINIPLLSNKMQENALSIYYSSFSNHWIPGILVEITPVPQEKVLSIKNKYLALESNK